MNATTDHDHNLHWRNKLLKRLQRLLEEQDLDLYRAQVAEFAAKLDVDIIDCAAALVCLHRAGQGGGRRSDKAGRAAGGNAAREIKMLRYRLEIGRRHQVSAEEIKALLIDESGVEEKMIGPVDIRGDFTLITLPEGMPADIYQHLQSVELKDYRLKIKRLRGNKNIRRKKSGQRGRRSAGQSGKSDRSGGRGDALHRSQEKKSGPAGAS